MSARIVYDYDCASAELCREMQRIGVNFDLKRAQEMRSFLLGLEASQRKKIEGAAGRSIESTKSGGFKQRDLVSVYDELEAPVLAESEKTGLPSYKVDVLREYALGANQDLADFASAMLEWRRIRKIRSTYVDGMIRALNPETGRLHPVWMNYGAISGRWSCQHPNLMNLPRFENDPTVKEFEGGIRSLIIASVGCRFVYFDASQLEMRMAAYASGDVTMISACESSDLHSANAELIFGDKFLAAEGAKRKALRTLAKTAAFAVCYLAEVETVYKRLLADGQAVSISAVRAMLNKLHRSFRTYYRWQETKLEECIRTGYVESPIMGRRRFLGHDPAPTECANFPIQGGAADLVNIRANEIYDELRELNIRAPYAAQIHDALALDTPEKDIDRVSKLSREIFESSIEISSSGRTYRPSFPIDLSVVSNLGKAA